MNEFDDEGGGFHFLEWLREFFLRLDGPSFGATRSAQWSHVRGDFIKIHPACAVCGKTKKLLQPNNVHHIRPFHLHPDLELDPKNLITLCRTDHFLFGHLLNWSSYNVDVVADSEAMFTKVENRP